MWVLRGGASVRTLGLSEVVRPEARWGPALERNRAKSLAEGGSAPPLDPNEGVRVAYNEGHCFITNAAPLYTTEQNESHI